jgi:Tfp pilus assembly PilM family ATPase
MKIKQHLGISFCDNRIQLAEIDHTKKSAVTVLAQQDSPVDFINEGASLSASHAGVAALAKALTSMFQKSRASAGHISFALPTNPLFINTIPVDPSLKDDELKEYLKWEVRQYFPDAGATEFINDAHEIPSKDKDVRKTFVVSVRRGMVAFLQKVTAQLNLKLQIIDIDHFSSEKTLIANYPEHKKEVVALFGVGMNGVNASLVKNHEMVDYRAYVVDSNTTLGKTIAKYIKDNKQQNGTEKIAAAYLHGPQVTSSAATALKAEAGVQTQALNAFRKLIAADTVDKALIKESHRFAAAIGLALRTE